MQLLSHWVLGGSILIKRDGDDDDDDKKIQLILECFKGGETLMTSFMVKLMN